MGRNMVGIKRLGTLVAAPALVVLAGLLCAPGALAAPGVPQQSSNWAGYAVSDTNTISTGTTDPAVSQPLQFTSVTATWKLPAVTCTPGDQAFSAFWVGLGGYATDAQALEQTGTDADCTSAGKPSYYVWYELVPAPSIRVNLKVGAGDTITASVNWYADRGAIGIQVKDRSRKTSFTKFIPMGEPDLSSAEWIAEAPSECSSLGDCRVLPLANFGSVGFTNVATIGNLHPGTLTDPTWAAAAIQLVPHSDRTFMGTPDDASKAGATPAALTADGRTFSVVWLADAADA
jgi:hypothetical protein